MLFIIFFVIVIDESVDNILIEAIIPLSNQYSWLTDSFVVASLPFALFLGGWSDFHCRRKTIIFALFSILISIVMLVFYNMFLHNWMAFTSLIIKAIGGNAIPIALAAILDVMPHKKFRSSLAIAICGYSVGSWVPIYFRSHLGDLTIIISISTFVSLILVFLWFKDYEFDGIKLSRNQPNLRQFLFFIRKEIKQIFLFVITPLIALFYLGFIFNEMSFYQILLRGEFLQKDNYYAFASIILGGAYYFGTLILFILERFHFNDLFNIKLGLFISFLSILFITFLNFINVQNEIFYIILIGFFSIGFALITPSIFAFFSHTRKEEEQGKIYGLLDSTDSVAFLASAWYINRSMFISYKDISLISLTLFVVSSIIILIFVKLIRASNAKSTRS